MTTKRIWLISIASVICGLIVGTFGTTIFFREITENKNKAAWALGQEHLEAKNFDQAISMFNQSVAFSPKRYDPHLGLAQAYEELGVLDVALKEYKIAAELISGENLYDKADKIAILSKIGDIYAQRGSYKDAINAYQEGIKINPKWPDPYYGLGQAYRKVGDNERAKENLQVYLVREIREKRAERKENAQKALAELDKESALMKKP
jgi:tetratricopeptide (TPR) repeat protein